MHRMGLPVNDASPTHQILHDHYVMRIILILDCMQDFKEAARLAAEAKSVAAEADSSLDRAQALRQQAQEAEAAEAATAAGLDALAIAVEAASRDADAVRLRRLLVGSASAYKCMPKCHCVSPHLLHNGKHHREKTQMMVKRRWL